MARFWPSRGHHLTGGSRLPTVSRAMQRILLGDPIGQVTLARMRSPYSGICMRRSVCSTYSSPSPSPTPSGSQHRPYPRDSKEATMTQTSMSTAHSVFFLGRNEAFSGVADYLQPCFMQSKESPRYASRSTTRTDTWLCKGSIPRDAWDSHMHVIDDNYDLAPDAVYQPDPHTIDDAISFESSVGIQNMVLVQPSIYGNDNSCLLAALEKLGGNRARGVVAFDPVTITSKQLHEWHVKGVRGVRLNISSVGRTIKVCELESLLWRYADAVRPFNWAVQVYMPMHLIESIESTIPKLKVRFCIDHLGDPALMGFTSIKSPYELPGFASMTRLLRKGHIFVKLSAPYRLSQTRDLHDLEPVAKEILKVGGRSRVVFASDWPHTRFEGLDIRPFIERVLEWCNGDEYLVDRLFRDNAEELWSVMR